MLRAGLMGVTGYTGMELARILASHPNFQLTMATSRQEAGKRLGQLYPFLEGLPGSNVVVGDAQTQQLAANCDVVFLAVPHGVAMESGAQLYDLGAKVVDLSADFRLRDAKVFETWYQTPHQRPSHLAHAVYGLPELYAKEIASTRLVANPGCYPSASILALYAALKADIIHREDVVIDAKSGASGAGRKAVQSSLYCEVADTFRAYNLGKHRHTPEIEQELSVITGQNMLVSFNPHLLPMNRGILATIYTKLKTKLSGIQVHEIFSQTWNAHPWVRVLPLGSQPETRNVRGSMFCDLGITVDERIGRLIITSAIDNLCRGASGQAIANANLMCGLPLTSGLNAAPLL